MNFSQFDQAEIALHSNTRAESGQPYAAHLDDILNRADCATAQHVIEGWNGYRPTPLHTLNGLADDLGLAALYYKDEGSRFGLGSFKALGGAYAVLRLLAREIPKLTGQPASDADISAGKYAEFIKGLTVITATDGNHGRSVAWGARQFGCPCKIYMHAGVSKARRKAVADLGAEVVGIDGSYDESVHAAAADAAANGWFIVSDTSYEGYMDLPRHVMAGYTVMTSEIMEQFPDRKPPSHVFVQGGVGGLAGAVCGHFWQAYGADRPRFVIVEPDRAACLYQSALHGRPTVVTVSEETIMAGLSCGEVSLLGWDILSPGTDDFMTITDDLIAPTMRRLAAGEADPVVVAGESAVAGLAGLIAARRSPTLSAVLGLDTSSTVLVIGTEGATDPAIYETIVGHPPTAVAA